jgi:hypothetical protein
MSYRNLTAAVIDSRDSSPSSGRSEVEPLMSKGTRIAPSGGVGCNDHRAIWEALDRVLAKQPDMVLMRGGATKGAEFVASRWGDARPPSVAASCQPAAGACPSLTT